MDAPILENAWETFLKIESGAQLDEAPPFDAGYLVSKGIEPESPTVLRLIRDEVLPLVRLLERDGLVNWYSFLVHNRHSGVPTSDDGVYLHLRLTSLPAVDVGQVLSRHAPKWVMTRRAALSTEIAGLDLPKMSLPLAGGAIAAWKLLGEQSEWLLRLVEAHHDRDLAVLTRHTRQFLHFLANMTQMRVA